MLKIQGTRKIGCPAKLKTFTYVHSVTLHSINCVDLLDATRLAIRDGTAKSCRKYFVSLPTTEAHSAISVVHQPTFHEYILLLSTKYQNLWQKE